MRILVLDNYDSFTYNLVQYLQELLGQTVTVCRNDAISLDAVADFEAIVLSPGPGLPADAGIMPELIARYADKKPILGVCLGHQAIGEAFGARLLNLAQVYHGIETPVSRVVADEPLFEGLPQRFQAGRYHSWVIDPDTLPDVLEVTAVDDKGTIMAVRHRHYNVRGLQFHPESIMTTKGKAMLRNYLAWCRQFLRQQAPLNVS